MKKFISEIKLLGDDEFSIRFNKVSDAFAKWEEVIGTDKEDELYQEWFRLKLALEQGYPM